MGASPTLLVPGVVAADSCGIAMCRGSGVDLTMEFLYAAAYSNLFTDIYVGLGTEPFGWVIRWVCRAYTVQ